MKAKATVFLCISVLILNELLINTQAQKQRGSRNQIQGGGQTGVENQSPIFREGQTPSIVWPLTPEREKVPDRRVPPVHEHTEEEEVTPEMEEEVSSKKVKQYVGKGTGKEETANGDGEDVENTAEDEPKVASVKPQVVRGTGGDAGGRTENGGGEQNKGKASGRKERV